MIISILPWKLQFTLYTGYKYILMYIEDTSEGVYPPMDTLPVINTTTDFFLYPHQSLCNDLWPEFLLDIQISNYGSTTKNKIDLQKKKKSAVIFPFSSVIGNVKKVSSPL